MANVQKAKNKPTNGLSATREQKRDFNRVYGELIGKYRTKRRPVDVDFRQIVPKLSGIDRATHLLHP